MPPLVRALISSNVQARSKIDDELKAEMLVNTNITTPDPEKGFEVVLATFCWSKAKYKLSKNVSKPKEMWLGDGELRVLLTVSGIIMANGREARLSGEDTREGDAAIVNEDFS